MDFFQPTNNSDLNNLLLEYFVTFKKMSYSIESNIEFNKFRVMTTILYYKYMLYLKWLVGDAVWM
jgi:hypothetical protein